MKPHLINEEGVSANDNESLLPPPPFEFRSTQRLFVLREMEMSTLLAGGGGHCTQCAWAKFACRVFRSSNSDGTKSADRLGLV